MVEIVVFISVVTLADSFLISIDLHIVNLRRCVTVVHKDLQIADTRLLKIHFEQCGRVQHVTLK